MPQKKRVSLETTIVFCKANIMMIAMIKTSNDMHYHIYQQKEKETQKCKRKKISLEVEDTSAHKHNTENVTAEEIGKSIE